MYQKMTDKDFVARKKHKCDWCMEKINKGEKYNYQAFIFDGEFYEWRSHLACNRVVSAIWDYVDPDEGMSSEEFDEGCADVCREFICLDCHEWNKEDGCEKDKLYCIDKLDKFFKTHELYQAKREGFYRIWKARERRRISEVKE